MVQIERKPGLNVLLRLADRLKLDIIYIWDII